MRPIVVGYLGIDAGGGVEVAGQRVVIPGEVEKKEFYDRGTEMWYEGLAWLRLWWRSRWMGGKNFPPERRLKVFPR